MNMSRADLIQQLRTGLNRAESAKLDTVGFMLGSQRVLLVLAEPEKTYGVWAGSKHGNPYNPERCAQSVMQNVISSQCARLKGHGPKGLYCKQHAVKNSSRIDRATLISELRQALHLAESPAEDVVEFEINGTDYSFDLEPAGDDCSCAELGSECPACEVEQ